MINPFGIKVLPVGKTEGAQIRSLLPTLDSKSLRVLLFNLENLKQNIHKEMKQREAAKV